MRLRVISVGRCIQICTVCVHVAPDEYVGVEWGFSLVFCQWNRKSFLPNSAMEAGVQLSALAPPLYPGYLRLHD